MKNTLQNLIQAVTNAIIPGPLVVDIPAAWLEPIHPDLPCGPHLEYDPEFAVLAARLTPKAEVQYGQFKARANEPEWKDIERDCQRLLLRSKDLNLLIWFTRSRTRQAGAPGLLQGLSSLQQICALFSDTVHPQMHIEGEHDPMVRANALAALCDPEGLLEEVREVLIVSSNAQRLSVRDVERALAVPRAAYALDADAVQRQLIDLYQKRDPQLLALQASAACVQYLQTWANQCLQDHAPTLLPLSKLLQPLLGSACAVLPVASHKVQAEPADSAHAPESPQPPIETMLTNAADTATPLAPLSLWSQPALSGTRSAGSAKQNREEVRQALAQVRAWIEENEPSSPVCILLKQAERMWGKRFSEVAHMIPPELLQAWDKND